VQVEERFGSGGGLAWAVMLRGQLAQTLGAWDDARRDFRRSIDLYRTLSPTVFSIYGSHVMGELDLLTGARDAGKEAVEQALTEFRTFRHRIGIQRAEVALAELALVEGRPEDAIARLESWREESSDSEVLFVVPVLAEAYLLTGRCARARAILDAARGPAQARGYRILEAPLHRVRGCVAAREGRWEAARQAFEEALAADGRMPVPFERARALHHYGLAEAGCGDGRAARGRLLEALAIFRRLGARPYVHRVEQDLTLLAHLLQTPRETAGGRNPAARLPGNGANRTIPG
jgi:tetratricopeptide (TPR) repeat protein